MKTDNSQSIRRNRWFRLASSLMATLFLITCIASCSEEDISGDITGKYGNLTGADNTVITIGTRGDGYTMKCTYEDFGSGEYFEWNGTFKNLPTDAVVGSNGEEIGEIHFSGTDAVTFTAYTQKKDSYKAYRDELTDLPRSGQQPTDSIPAPEKK